MRSSMARCLASNAVVVCGLSLSLLKSEENGKKPERDGAVSAAGGAGMGAGDVGAMPVLGCGAGVGSGTFSACDGPVAKAVHIAAANNIVARRPAIVFSCRTVMCPATAVIRYARVMANSRLPRPRGLKGIKGRAVDSQ